MTAPTASPTTPTAPATSQAAQAAVAVAIGLAITKLWPSLDVAHLRRSLPGFKAAVAVEVQRHAQASAALAARQYQQQRVAAVGAGGYTPAPADPPPVALIAQAADWAVQPLWNSSPAIADAKARLAASSERLVLDAGRDTIIANVERDRKAQAWARVPEPGACSFCLMLATRGATYRSERSAGFRSHDNCRCHVEPVFTAYEPSAAIRQAQALWATSTRGKSGNDARIAFRQAVEGRTKQ